MATTTTNAPPRMKLNVWLAITGVGLCQNDFHPQVMVAGGVDTSTGTCATIVSSDMVLGFRGLRLLLQLLDDDGLN